MPACSRFLTLDAMRGFAVMGILLMNIIAFSMPGMAYINPRLWGGETPIDYAMWSLNFVAIDGKMRGLFSLLFGASTLLIYDRPSALGGEIAPMSRSVSWLLLLGMCHYLFICCVDMLLLYAISGFIMLLFVRREPMDLIKRDRRN